MTKSLKFRAIASWAMAGILAMPLLNAQSYHNLSASDFTEDFSAISNTTTWATPIKVGGSWSGFAALTGTATIPSAIKTTTNSAAFTTGTSGGVQRGSAQSPAADNIVFLSTGGAGADNTTATALDLWLDFSNRTAGTLTFDAAELANSTGNRQGTLRVYYSADEGSTWTELAGTNLPFVATNNEAKSATISATLPSVLDNKPTAKLRFYYHNNAGGTSPTGSRPKITVDNVKVTSTSSVIGAPVISSPLTASVTSGSAFSYTITASGTPTSYSTSTLPAGLSFNSGTGVISGTPTASGTFNITLSATNGIGTGSAVLALTVDINPNAPVVSGGTTTGTVGQLFSYQINATNSPTSYTAAPLPAGLVLDPVTGIISGTPTVGGSFTNIAISATNSSGSASALLSITIASAPVLNGSFSASCYVGQAFAYTISASQNPALYNAQEIVDGQVPGLSYDGVTSISGTPSTAGTYTFTILAQNSLGTDTKTFVLKVIDQATQDAIPATVIINKYANAATSGGAPDQIELLVIGNGSPGSTADLRGMIVKDFSSTLNTDAGGKYEFASNSLWSAVPAGTLIVLSAGNTESEDLVVSDFLLKVNLGDVTYFTSLKIEAPGNSSAFDIATSEMIMIKPAGYGALGVAGGIHALGSVPTTIPTDGYAQWKAFTGKKLSSTGTTGGGLGIFANNATSSLADYVGTGATGGVAVTFGVANNSTNQTYITSLRSAPLSAVQTWRQTYFGTTANTGTAADTADFDGDGISNLLEYATGTNPTVANASVATVAQSGNFLTLTFNRINDPALTYTILASNDLTTGFTSTGTTYTGSAAGSVTYTDNVSLSTAGVRRFLRLQVSY